MVSVDTLSRDTVPLSGNIRKLMISSIHAGNFLFKFVPLNSKEKLFSVLIHFTVSFLDNVAYADKLCCSVVPQALYSNRHKTQSMLLCLLCFATNLTSPCGVRIIMAKGLAGFIA
jgi:hypothetical protein